MSSAAQDRSALLAAGLIAVALAWGAGTVLLVHGRDRVAPAGDRPSYAAIPLVDQDAEARSVASWTGRVIVLDFIYTGCGDTCPIKTGQLADVQQSIAPAIRDRVEFVSVSIDPEHDTPAALKAYAARSGADLSNWSFLTGTLGKVARFAAAFDAGLESDTDVATHITTIRLLDGNGRVLQRYMGESVDAVRLLRDIDAHASGRSSQPSDRAPS